MVTVLKRRPGFSNKEIAQFDDFFIIVATVVSKKIQGDFLCLGGLPLVNIAFPPNCKILWFHLISF